MSVLQNGRLYGFKVLLVGPQDDNCFNSSSVLNLSGDINSVSSKSKDTIKAFSPPSKQIRFLIFTFTCNSFHCTKKFQTLLQVTRKKQICFRYQIYIYQRFISSLWNKMGWGCEWDKTCEGGSGKQDGTYAVKISG